MIRPLLLFGLGLNLSKALILPTPVFLYRKVSSKPPKTASHLAMTSVTEDKEDIEPLLIKEEIDNQKERRAWRVEKRKEVLKFAGPALSTVLADPLLSVIDALCVGRFCDTVQLAALGPSLAVFNFVSYFFFFLNAATCVLITQSLTCDDNQGAQEVLSNALALAIGCGSTIGGLLYVFATILISSTGCVPDLVETATQYLRVRAVGLPVVLSSMVITSSLLGQLDTITPLQVILFAGVLNTIGDVWLVPMLGAPGAAWATVGAQLCAAPLLLYLCKTRKRIPIKLKKPKLAHLKKFLTTAGPLFFFEAGMSICYLIVESLSTRFGVMPAAAFRALWSPLSVMGFFTYPLKQAAQVFIPPMLNEAKDNPEKATIGGQPMIKEFVKVLSLLSTVSGIVLSGTSILLTRNPQWFTTDQGLWPILRSFSPYVAPILPLLGFAQVLEGVLIGSDDLHFLSLTQIGNIGISAIAIAVTNRILMGIHGTWVIYTAFLVARSVQTSLRVFFIKQPWKRAVSSL